MSTRAQKKAARRHTRKNTTSARTGGSPGLTSPAGAGHRSTAPAQRGSASAERGALVGSPAPGQLAPGAPGGSGCAAEVSEAGPQALAATYWLDAPTSGPPRVVTIRFVGTRAGLTGTPGPGDRSEHLERVDGIAAGCGRVAITTRISGINRGQWRVTAAPVTQTTTRSGTTTRAAATIGTHWGRDDVSAHTQLTAVAYGPGVRVWTWPALVSLGVVVAIVIQAMLLGRAHTHVEAVAAISVEACVAGFLCAKIWYLVQNRKPVRDFLQPAGACIQGFLVGALGTLAIAVAVSGLPLGTILDASTPGLFRGWPSAARAAG